MKDRFYWWLAGVMALSGLNAVLIWADPSWPWWLLPVVGFVYGVWGVAWIKKGEEQ